MDEVISNEASVSSDSTIIESEYNGVESMTLQDYALGQNASIGLGAAATGVLVSLCIASLIRFFSSL